MSSPNPNQQYQFPYYAAPTFQQAPHGYPTHHGPEPVKYTQPAGMPASFVAELPGSKPADTSVATAFATTSPQQLSEDEILARRLQEVEVEEAKAKQATSSSDPSQLKLNAGAVYGSHNPASEAYIRQQATGPHSTSITSLPAHESQAPSQLSPSLLPEVVVGLHSGPTPKPLPARSSPSLLPEVVSGSPQIPAHAPLPQIPSHASTPQILAPRASPFPQNQFAPAPPDPRLLAAYLEQHRQVPYPPQWNLSPVIKTFYSSFEYAPKSDFLDTLESQIWRTTRFTATGHSAPPPAFKFKFKTKGGSFRDPQLSWTMTINGETKKAEWAYNLKLDKNTGIRKSEDLTPPKSKMAILTTYVHAVNYDTLRFVGPDGLAYKWVTHAPFQISVKGFRYDTLRHALFVADPRSGVQDPLYGRIVADHAYWDGFVDTADVHTGITCTGCSAKPINGIRWKCNSCADHDSCEPCRLSGTSITPACRLTLVSLPNETLYIREPGIDVAMVVGTLQVLKDWQLHALREQRTRDPVGFQASVNEARNGDLGRMRYWRSSDFETPMTKGEVRGTVMKAVACMRPAEPHRLVKEAPAK